MNKIIPTTHEVVFSENELIVSKTDLKGWITYTNHVFHKVSGFQEGDLLGKPHSVIRHPDMPRCMFRLLWERLQAGHEVFAYIKNICKNGDHYWVLAHVTPTVTATGEVVGYHSNRRLPDRQPVMMAERLYRHLKNIEDAAPGPKEGLTRAYDVLMKMLQDQNISYDRFVFDMETYFRNVDFDKTPTDYRMAG